ncbi:hypothetical protein ERUR111494_04545 [Erysipelothrix urinaevulpis]|uniref:hypothetical protein n=1 Tax=Erysipelothrix urinaevulpis TaxID=2683717 RepID=UPI00135C48B2|nr:hypothetical protein [Erysipelothrix urinaevulpis]
MKTIIINSPIMQDKVQKIVEAIESPKFTFVKKEGIKLYFETDAEDVEAACKLVKAEIKSDPIAGAIMFTVKSEEYI